MSVSSLSAYSQALKKPAFTAHIEPALYVSGSTVWGKLELDSKRLQEDNIQLIYAKLQGTILTKNRMAAGSHEFKVVANEFLRETVTPWVRERAAHTTFGDVINIPFGLKLPANAPPSFGFESYMNNAHVRYAVEVVGVVSAASVLNTRAEFPVLVVQNDPIGNNTHTELKLGWSHTWGRLKAEDNVRKYPWGEYAHARMELFLPHVDTFPLFTDIPYTIVITTLSAPTKRKDNMVPDKNLFPQVPRSASEIDFEMRRFVEMETPYQPSNPEEHVVDIISKAHAPVPPVKVEVGGYTWVPEQGREDRGRWQQEATYSSSMNLRYTPTFITEEVKIKYTLFLRIDFSGSGNVLRLYMPITIGSGVETPILLDATVQRTIDLPASYWDPSSWTA